MTSSPRLHLFHFPDHGPSLAIRIFLSHLGLPFQTHEINILVNENFDDWYLTNINKNADVPILLDQKTKRLVNDHTYILSYLHKIRFESDFVAELSPEDRCLYEGFLKAVENMPKDPLVYRFLAKSPKQAGTTTTSLANAGNTLAVHILNAILDHKVALLRDSAKGVKEQPIKELLVHELTELHHLKGKMNSPTELLRIHDDVVTELSHISELLSSRDGTYALGDEFTIMDAILAALLYEFEKSGLPLFLTKFPAVEKYYKFIKKNPAVIAAIEEHPITLDLVLPIYKMLALKAVQSKQAWTGLLSVSTAVFALKSMCTPSALLGSLWQSVYETALGAATPNDITIYF